MIKVKCLFCNSYFDRETVPCVKIGRRYAHKTCVEGNQELTAEYQEKESFWAYIKKIYGSKYNFQLINTQATQYIEAYHYTWKSMENALRWFYEVKKGNIDEGNGGIGIIPFIYDEANKYYEQMNLTKAKNEKKGGSSVVVEVQTKSPRAWKQPPRMFDWEEDD